MTFNFIEKKSEIIKTNVSPNVIPLELLLGFFKFVVTPLFSEWHRFLRSALSTHMMEILDENRKRWETQEVAEQAEETQTELSEAEIDISDEEELTKRSLETPSIHDFIPPPHTRYVIYKMHQIILFSSVILIFKLA